jgi:hypothetical protein
VDRFERRPALIRIALLYLAVSSAYLAIWILVAPKGFYDAFPTGPGEWVSALPPYNEHLERDYGSALLGLAALAAAAAFWMDRRVTQATAIAYLVGSLPHLAYHLTTTDHYSTGDNIQSLIGLALPVAIAVGLFWAASGPAPVGREKAPDAAAPPAA